MSKIELHIFLQSLEKEKKAATSNTKQQSETFLKSIGLLKKNGKIAKPYREICIQKSLA